MDLIPPPQFSKYTGFCMGNMYVNSRALKRDLADIKVQNDAIQIIMDNQFKLAQQQTLQAPPSVMNQNRLFQMLPPVIQTALQNFIVKPLQAFIGLLNIPTPAAMNQAFTQAVQKAGSVLEAAMSKVAGFFFGSKKQKTEAEKEARDRDDDAEIDFFDSLFGKLKMKSNSGSNNTK